MDTINFRGGQIEKGSSAGFHRKILLAILGAIFSMGKCNAIDYGQDGKKEDWKNENCPNCHDCRDSRDATDMHGIFMCGPGCKIGCLNFVIKKP